MVMIFYKFRVTLAQVPAGYWGNFAVWIALDDRTRTLASTSRRRYKSHGKIWNFMNEDVNAAGKAVLDSRLASAGFPSHTDEWWNAEHITSLGLRCRCLCGEATSLPNYGLEHSSPDIRFWHFALKSPAMHLCTCEMLDAAVVGKFGEAAAAAATRDDVRAARDIVPLEASLKTTRMALLCTIEGCVGEWLAEHTFNPSQPGLGYTAAGDLLESWKQRHAIPDELPTVVYRTTAPIAMLLLHRLWD